MPASRRARRPDPMASPVARKQDRTAQADIAERVVAAATRRPAGIAELGWLAERRRAAAERFRALGLPTQHLEAWKYTSLRPLAELAFAAPATPPAAPSDLAGLGEEFAHRLVLVDGVFAPHLSRLDGLPAGAELASLGELIAREPLAMAAELDPRGRLPDNALFALNSVALADGFVLRLAPGVVLEAPVHVVYLASGADRLSQPRNLVRLAEGARASLVEQHAALGGAAHFANGVTQIALAKDAALAHLRLQHESAAAIHVWQTEAAIGAGASYESFALAEGARLARNEIRAYLEGEGASCRLDGAYLAAGAQHLDTTTVIEHLRPRTTSRESYKGILDDRSRGVFQGRVVVHAGAVKTDGHQLNRALLLSDRAEIDCKPELEIYADDVKCGHGAAAGALDEEALFYLRARGVPLAQARAILVEAFVGEVIEAIGDPRLRALAAARAGAWIGQRQEDKA
jgi:Fe-S cluster assembly protein SufD